MAKALTGALTWYVNTSAKALTHVDMATLSNGKVAVAFGGSAAGPSQLNTTLLNAGFTAFGAINTKTYPASSGLTTLREIEITATASGTFATTFTVNNTSIGPDTNFGGLLQLHGATGVASGAGKLLDPAGKASNMADDFSTVRLSNGNLVTFYNAGPNPGFDWSTGIRMDTFNAAGTFVSTKTVVTDPNLGLFLVPSATANPEKPDAVLMSNGNIGLVYYRNIAVGTGLFATASSQIEFREINPTTGAIVGSVLPVVTGTGVEAEIVKLNDGRLLVVWTDVTSAGFRAKAQILSANGDTKIGSAFNVSSYQTGNESVGDVVAMPNGGFAISWSIGNGYYLARMFDSTGAALGNDFLLTERTATFAIGGDGEMTVAGGRLLGMTVGVLNGEIVQKVFGQHFALDSTVGISTPGTTGPDTRTGGANDDTFDGLAGIDTLNGNAGNDILIGGANNDTLNGGIGRDVLHGGLGADRSTGGLGSDVFIFMSKAEAGDTILDFKRAEGDKIALDNLGWATFIGTFSTPFTGVALVTNDSTPNDVGVHFNTSTKVLSYDPDGAGATFGRIVIATLPGVASLSATDFLLV